LNKSDIEILSQSAEDTSRIGKEIGSRIKSGTVIALTGDLGCGKTAFVQGLAKGLDVPADYPITSPTYTLINEYPGRYPLFHIDLYRLENRVDFEDIGLYDILDSEGVAAVEWAERLSPELLSDALHIHIEFAGDDSRRIRIIGSTPESADLIIKINDLTLNT
jgi:tRNA threonylcarbamoyladenosine biosynthesis protein TsaE